MQLLYDSHISLTSMNVELLLDPPSPSQCILVLLKQKILLPKVRVQTTLNTSEPADTALALTTVTLMSGESSGEPDGRSIGIG